MSEKTNLLEITQEQASRIVATLLMVGFCIFMIGYVIGKRMAYAKSAAELTVPVVNPLIEAAENFTENILPKNLSENLNTKAIIDLGEDAEDTSENNYIKNSSQNSLDNSNSPDNLNSASLPETKSSQIKFINSNAEHNSSKNINSSKGISSDLVKPDLINSKIEKIKLKKISEEPERVLAKTGEKRYCGQLAGFITQKAAEKYLHDIERKGFSARLIERKSISSSGIERKWYQVATQYFNNKNDLENLITQMRKARLCNAVEIVYL